MTRLSKYRNHIYYSQARRKLSKVAPNAALPWAQSAIWAAQEALDDYQRTGAPGALEGALRAVVGGLACVDVLLDKDS